MKKLLAILILLASVNVAAQIVSPGGSGGSGGGSVSEATVSTSGKSKKGQRAKYAIASLPTCNSSTENITVDVSDGNRAPRTCRNTDGSNYRWVDEDGGRFNITRFGGDPAAGSTGSDDAAMAAVITAATASGGEVYLPAGQWDINTPSGTTITNKSGFKIRGAGKSVTIISPGTGYAGVPVFKLVNCRDSSVTDLWILGNVSGAPSAGINSRVDTPRSIVAINLTFSGLIIGSNSSSSIVDGVLFDYNTTSGACGGSTCDQNNEQHKLNDVEVRNYTGAGIHIEGLNSTWHVFNQLYIHGGADGIKTTGTGGGFTAYGVRFSSSTGYEFHFLAPTQGASITQVYGATSEATSTPLLKTNSSNIRFQLVGYARSSGTSGTNMIEWASSGGELWIRDSVFNSGTTNTPLIFSGSGTIHLEGVHAFPGTTPTNSGTHTILATRNNWEDGTLDADLSPQGKVNGGSAANDDLTLQGTTNATRSSSYVFLQPNGGSVAQGTTSPSSVFSFSPFHHIRGTAPGLRLDASGGANLEFGADTSRAYMVTTGAHPIRFYTDSTSRWDLTATGHLFANTDNAYDIGASGANRPRDIYIARNLVVGGTCTGCGAIVSTSAAALTVGDAINYQFQVDASTASVATGLKVTGAAAGTAPSLAAISSGTNESLQLSAKGTGIVLIGDSGTATASSGAATLNAQRGTITSESLTTAAGASYTLTLTNSRITTTSLVLVSFTNGDNSQGTLALGEVTPGSGSATIVIRNIHASQALNGTIKIAFFVL